MFYENNFDKGLVGWGYELVSIQQKNGNNYAFLSGYTDCMPLLGPCHPVLAIMQKTLTGATPGATYQFSIKAIGNGKIAVNSSNY